MRHVLVPFLVLAGGAGAALAQDHGYENKELGIEFEGVYGWTRRVAAGSGAWTELANYSETAFDAELQLLVRDNPYGTIEELRRALEEEFEESEPGEGGAPGYKEIQFRDAEMRRGLKLPGIEVEAVATRVTEEGKKREFFLLSRTYFGANRLFRVHGVAKRSRMNKVRDLFERAAAGLVVEAAAEQVSRGVPFKSQQGRWACLVPAGFTIVLPPRSWNAEMVFERGGVGVSVYAYAYDGILQDHVEELLDYYGDAIKIDNDRASVLGGEGFEATVRKDGTVTLVTGAVRGRRVYRVHTTIQEKGALDEAKRAHKAFLETFRIG